jgi:hypothetical protein
MKLAGVWLAVIGVCWRVPVVCTQMISLFPPGATPNARGAAFVSGLGIEEIILAAVPGALLWIAAWIVEGFAQKEKS